MKTSRKNMLEKTCSKCGIEKPLEEFPLRKSASDGRRGECRICTNEYHCKYSKQPEQIKRVRDWFEKKIAAPRREAYLSKRIEAKLKWIGRQFGRLTIVEEAAGSTSECPRWLCRCVCGAKKVFYQSNLIKGNNTTSCGCYSRECSKSRFINLTNRKIRNWTVLYRDTKRKSKEGWITRWICRCDCGNVRSISVAELIGKTGQSCRNCCVGSGFNPSKPGLVYYIRINNPNGLPVYKIGITNSTIRRRFYRDLRKIAVIKRWRFRDGNRALAKEQRILQKYQQYRYKGANPFSYHNGITEMFRCDVLRLDRMAQAA
jgi:hypothetical protein